VSTPSFVKISIIHSHSFQCTSLSSSSTQQIHGIVQIVLFAEVAVHTYQKICQCLDALPGNPCAPVYLALVGSTVLASSFEMLDLLAEI